GRKALQVRAKVGLRRRAVASPHPANRAPAKRAFGELIGKGASEGLVEIANRLRAIMVRAELAARHEELVSARAGLDRKKLEQLERLRTAPLCEQRVDAQQVGV